MKDEKAIPYNFRIPAKLKTKLERHAKAEKRSLNKQMIVMLENAMNAKEKSAGRA